MTTKPTINVYHDTGSPFRGAKDVLWRDSRSPAPTKAESEWNGLVVFDDERAEVKGVLNRADTSTPNSLRELAEAIDTTRMDALDIQAQFLNATHLRYDMPHLEENDAPLLPEIRNAWSYPILQALDGSCPFWYIPEPSYMASVPWIDNCCGSICVALEMTPQGKPVYVGFSCRHLPSQLPMTDKLIMKQAQLILKQQVAGRKVTGMIGWCPVARWLKQSVWPSTTGEAAEDAMRAAMHELHGDKYALENRTKINEALVMKDARAEVSNFIRVCREVIG